MLCQIFWQVAETFISFDMRVEWGETPRSGVIAMCLNHEVREFGIRVVRV